MQLYTSAKMEKPDGYFPEMSDFWFYSACYTVAFYVLRQVVHKAVLVPLASNLLRRQTRKCQKSELQNGVLGDKTYERGCSGFTGSKQNNNNNVTWEGRRRVVTDVGNGHVRDENHSATKISEDNSHCQTSPRGDLHQQDDTGDHKEQVLKFTESAWRFLFYCVAVSYGYWVMHECKWLEDVPGSLLEGYPEKHVIEPGMFHYFTGEMGFYMASLVWLFQDARKKDFRNMFFHHVVTAVCLIHSWQHNFIRGVALVVFLHDLGDPFLELAKLSVYIGLARVADFVFACFMFVWFTTRLYYVPVVIFIGIWFSPQGQHYSAGETIWPGIVMTSLGGLTVTVQVVWTRTLLKVLWNRLAHSRREDIREDQSASQTNDGGEKGWKQKKA